MPGHRLALPATLDFGASFLRILSLALWVPLLQGLLGGPVGGRLFQLLAGVLGLDLATTPRLQLLALLAAAILLTAMVIAVATVTAVRTTDRLSVGAEVRVAEELLRRHLRYGQAYLDQVAESTTVRHLQRLPNQASRLLVLLRRTAAGGLELSLFFVLMGWLSLPLAGAAAVALTLYAFLLRRLVDDREEIDEEDLQDEAAAEVHDLVRNLALLRQHGGEENTATSFRTRSHRRLETAWHLRRRVELADEVREVLNVSLLLLFVLGAGWVLGRSGSGMLSRYLVFFLVLRRAMTTVGRLQKIPRQWRSTRRHLTQLRELLSSDRFEEVPGGDLPWPGLGEGIVVRDLRFSYPGGEPALRGIDLDLPPGRLTALVGHNGSGKSTLLKLLARLYDCPPGSIQVGGCDVRTIDREQLRGRMTLADSTPLLLRDTLARNLAYGLDWVAPEELQRALRWAGLEAVVGQLPAGLEEVVGTGQARLSAGELQRIGLARAFLRDADLVFLDEATSSIAPDAERELLTQLAEYARDRCVVLVSHRPENLPPDTWTVVLRDGRVVARGPASSVLAGADLP